MHNDEIRSMFSTYRWPCLQQKRAENADLRISDPSSYTPRFAHEPSI
jgi:hypothetical protein